MLKDLTLSQEAAKSSGAQTPLGEHARRLYEAYSEAGFAGSDFSGIVRFLREGGAI
jgi:3-hydroxyisobutyrate dehydrogenase